MSVIPASWKSMPKALPALLFFPLVVLLAAALSLPTLFHNRTIAFDANRQALARPVEQTPALEALEPTERNDSAKAGMVDGAPMSSPAGKPIPVPTMVAEKSAAAHAPSATTARKLVRTSALELT